MKSNYHVVREAVEHRGQDDSNSKQGGAKRSNWAFNAKHERTNTSRVRVIHPREEVMEYGMTPLNHNPTRDFILARSYTPMKRERK